MGYRVFIKLRESVLAYKRRTGKPMTYAILARRTGLAEGTLQNIGSRRQCNANLSTIAKICGALGITPGDLLELVKEPPKAKPKPRRPAKSRNAAARP